jgi:hypothetical protein
MADLMGEVLGAEATEVNVPKPVSTQSLATIGEPSGMVTAVVPGRKLDEAQDKVTSEEVAGIASEPIADVCRVCGTPFIPDHNFCGNCGMLAALPDQGMQGKWASMWFMQQAQKAVETGQNQGERLWPLHGAKAQNVNAQTNSSPTPLNENPSDLSDSHTEIQETDQTVEVITDVKRSPRSVLSVLKSRFKVRAIGQ